nr:VOC family protein [Motiliproteus sediminis]
MDHVVLRVADTARSADFYATLLDCSVERRVDKIGLVQLRAGDSLIDLLPVATPPADANLDHFCLLIEPFDEALIRQRCQRLGIDCPCAKRRYGATGFGPSIYLQDPDGNRVELKGRGGV